MQILHPFARSIQQYAEEISNADRHRPHRLRPRSQCGQAVGPLSLKNTKNVF